MSQHHRNSRHTTMTARMRPILAASLPATCPRCGRTVYPDQPWDVSHVVDLAEGGDPNDVRAEHRRCNRSAGGKAGRAAQQRKPETAEFPTWF